MRFISFPKPRRCESQNFPERNVIRYVATRLFLLFLSVPRYLLGNCRFEQLVNNQIETIYQFSTEGDWLDLSCAEGIGFLILACQIHDVCRISTTKSG